MKNLSILSSQLYSDVALSPPIRVGIDKMKLFFPLGRDFNSVRHLIVEPIDPNRITTNFRCSVPMDEDYIYLKVNQEKNEVRAIDFNPNKFRCFQSVLKQLERIFPNLRGARIVRVDFNADMKSPFKDIIKILEVSYKRTNVSYTTSAGRYTGVNFGKGNERIVIYDRLKEHRDNEYQTRVEVRWGYGKIPFRNIYDLINNLDQLNPFERVKFNKIILTKHASELKSSLDLVSFFTWNSWGLQIAKKTHKHPKNFNRDMKRFFTCQRTRLDLDDIFQKNIASFTGC